MPVGFLTEDQRQCYGRSLSAVMVSEVLNEVSSIIQHKGAPIDIPGEDRCAAYFMKRHNFIQKLRNAFKAENAIYAQH
jgi:hypothetical protein